MDKLPFLRFVADVKLLIIVRDGSLLNSLLFLETRCLRCARISFLSCLRVVYIVEKLYVAVKNSLLMSHWVTYPSVSRIKPFSSNLLSSIMPLHLWFHGPVLGARQRMMIKSMSSRHRNACCRPSSSSRTGR